jgi:hypothetical protein
MIPDEIPATPGPGHNSGATLLQVARLAQETALEEYHQRRSEFLTSASRQTVTDRQSAADAADTIALAAKVWKLIDEDRQKRTDPYREVHSTLIAMASEFWYPVEEAMNRLLAQIDAFSETEDRLIADQQREQEEAMAALRARAAGVAPAVAPIPVQSIETVERQEAQTGRAYIDYVAPAAQYEQPARLPGPTIGSPARRSKIRGDLGGTISRDQEKIYEIEDIKALPSWIFETETVMNAIINVAKSNARHMPNIPGIRTRLVPKTTVK